MGKAVWMLVIGALAAAAWADDRGGLRGVQRLAVVVEGPAKESAGLDTEAMRQDVELKLGLGGIEVAKAPAEGPVLHLDTKTLFLQTDGVHRFTFVMIDLEVLQDVRRPDGYEIRRASTWSQEKMLVLPAGANVDHEIRKSVGLLVDALLADHLQANPAAPAAP
jgi:hypothetical protein